MNRDDDKIKLEKLQHGSSCNIAWFEEGGGLVFKIYDVYVLFGVGQYGGEPDFVGTYSISQIDSLLDLAYSWT